MLEGVMSGECSAPSSFSCLTNLAMPTTALHESGGAEFKSGDQGPPMSSSHNLLHIIPKSVLTYVHCNAEGLNVFYIYKLTFPKLRGPLRTITHPGQSGGTEVCFPVKFVAIVAEEGTVVGLECTVLGKLFKVLPDDGCEIESLWNNGHVWTILPAGRTLQLVVMQSILGEDFASARPSAISTDISLLGRQKFLNVPWVSTVVSAWFIAQRSLAQNVVTIACRLQPVARQTNVRIADTARDCYIHPHLVSRSDMNKSGRQQICLGRTPARDSVHLSFPTTGDNKGVTTRRCEVHDSNAADSPLFSCAATLSSAHSFRRPEQSADTYVAIVQTMDVADAGVMRSVSPVLLTTRNEHFSHVGALLYVFGTEPKPRPNVLRVVPSSLQRAGDVTLDGAPADYVGRKWSPHSGLRCSTSQLSIASCLHRITWAPAHLVTAVRHLEPPTHDGVSPVAGGTAQHGRKVGDGCVWPPSEVVTTRQFAVIFTSRPPSADLVYRDELSVGFAATKTAGVDEFHYEAVYPVTGNITSRDDPQLDPGEAVIPPREVANSECVLRNVSTAVLTSALHSRMDEHQTDAAEDESPRVLFSSLLVVAASAAAFATLIMIADDGQALDAALSPAAWPSCPTAMVFLAVLSHLYSRLLCAWRATEAGQHRGSGRKFTPPAVQVSQLAPTGRPPVYADRHVHVRGFAACNHTLLAEVTVNYTLLISDNLSLHQVLFYRA
jgi:hypothetical protein